MVPDPERERYNAPVRATIALVCASMVVLAGACLGGGNDPDAEQLRAENEALRQQLAEVQSPTARPPTPSATPAPVGEPTSTILSPPLRRHIGRTGGSGISVRSDCLDTARSPEAWPDGAEVVVERRGVGVCQGWSVIRLGATTSWVRDSYLVESAPVPEPRPTQPASIPAATATALPTATAPAPEPTVRPEDREAIRQMLLQLHIGLLQLTQRAFDDLEAVESLATATTAISSLRDIEQEANSVVVEVAPALEVVLPRCAQAFAEIQESARLIETWVRLAQEGLLHFIGSGSYDEQLATQTGEALLSWSDQIDGVLPLIEACGTG